MLGLFAVKFINIISGCILYWYLIKGGYKDGNTGIHLGKYAYDYTKKKYLKAKNYRKNFHTYK